MFFFHVRQNFMRVPSTVEKTSASTNGYPLLGRWSDPLAKLITTCRVYIYSVNKGVPTQRQSVAANESESLCPSESLIPPVRANFRPSVPAGRRKLHDISFGIIIWSVLVSIGSSAIYFWPRGRVRPGPGINRANID